MRFPPAYLLIILLCPYVIFAQEPTPELIQEPSQEPSQEQQQTLTDEEKVLQWAKSIWESLDRKTGKVILPNGVATLQVPKDFYYLNPDDANKILVEVWGNPPGEKPLGMLFPASYTPFDNGAWAVTIEYDEDGYVSDKDADKIDYSELLTQMQEGAESASRERVKQGYETIEVVGWAATPYYDKDANKLHWAKELKFGSQDVNTLNYNIRVLGRKGVLVLNFIAGMDQKKIVDEQLNPVLAMAEFNKGYRYDEFDPSMDKVAAYGIGALVAGKVLAKTGMLAAAFLFLKKFGVFILIGIGVLFGKLFKRGSSAS